MSNILKGLTEGRSYGRDSWDSNMPGYKGDYGGAENWDRRNKASDENDAIDARLRQQHAQRQEYEKSGKFWLKLKDSQRHLPAGPFTGKQAANTAALELLKQQPELKGNLVITAYGPDETQGVAEGSLNEGQYEMMLRNGQVKKFVAKDDADAKRIAAGHGAKSVIRLRGGVPAGKVSEQGVAEAEQVDSPKFQSAVSALKQMAQQGERKTVWDPVKRVYKTVPVNTPKKEEGVAEEEQVDENLRKWFKEKWVRFGPDGKIRGDCARGDDSEGKPKCLPQAKAHALGKKGRKYAASKKRREDPNPERSGKAINVATKKKSNEGVAEGSEERSQNRLWQMITDYEQRAKATKNDIKKAHYLKMASELRGKLKTSDEQGVTEEQLDEKCWDTHKQVGMKSKGGKMVPNCVPKESIEKAQQCPECGGPMFTDLLLAEKKDACYNKVRSRYKVWPSAYASGALVQCRKKGAANWGNKSKNESAILKGIRLESKETDHIIPEEQLDEKWSNKYKRSIDCDNPKGFSQRAHCQGKKND